MTTQRSTPPETSFAALEGVAAVFRAAIRRSGLPVADDAVLRDGLTFAEWSRIWAKHGLEMLALEVLPPHEESHELPVSEPVPAGRPAGRPV